MKAFFSSLLFVLVLACGKSSYEFSQYRRIQSKTYKEECSLTAAKIVPKINKTYYWFKANAIHHSKGDFGGELLNGSYKRYYITNELEIKGEFVNGLKKGLWKAWYKNGQLRKIEHWKNGLLVGSYQEFDATGKLTLKGKYNNGVKNGKWIDFVKKDTIHYNKGVIKLSKNKSKKIKSDKIKEKDNKTTKTSFLKRLFKKKKANSNVKS